MSACASSTGKSQVGIATGFGSNGKDPTDRLGAADGVRLAYVSVPQNQKIRWWTRSTENSSPAAWQAAQLSPSIVVLARAWEAVAISSWQPWHAAEMGAVVFVKPPGLVTAALAPTFSTR